MKVASTDEQLITQLADHEGCRLMPYHCPAGDLTIGFGHNLDKNGISHKVASLLLMEDIEMVMSQLDHAYPWWREMSLNRQRAIIDMTFNVGIGTLQTFKNMITAMKHGHYSTAADQMLLSKWAKQTGRRAQKLASMMRAG